MAWSETDGELPQPLDATALQGFLGEATAWHELPVPVTSEVRTALWLLLVADVAVGGGLLLLWPQEGDTAGAWDTLARLATLGGHATLTFALAAAGALVLFGSALLTGGFVRGSATQLGFMLVGGVVSVVAVTGSLLVLVFAAFVLVVVGGFVLGVLGALTEG